MIQPAAQLDPPAAPAVDVVASSRDVLAVHARSFKWASVFLPAGRRDDAAVLYAICRLIDDLADEAPDPITARRDLDRLRAELRGESTPRPLVAVTLEVFQRRQIPIAPLDELIEGVLGDLGPVRFSEDQELLRYCYRVAGTVGLMMCGVLGVSARQAWPHAIDLGVAMQLTNICRDVAEDWGRGRIYLPELGAPPEREAVRQAVRARLALADRYYASADAGMRYIPWRSRLAILVAGRIYRAIGLKLGRRGHDALAGRTVVGWGEKLLWIGGALAAFVRLSLAAPEPHDGDLHAPLSGLPGAAR